MSDNRKQVILEVIKAHPYGNQLAISREVKNRTGMGVAFPQLKKLREAVGAGNYDAVYDTLMANVAAAPAKRGPGRPRKEAPHVSAPIQQADTPPFSGTAPAASDNSAPQPVGKTRGDRRAKYEPRGRRKSDLNKIQLSDFSEHLVVCRTRDGLNQQTYKSRERAEQAVRQLLNSGISATDIAYYRLNPIKTTVTIEI